MRVSFRLAAVAAYSIFLIFNSPALTQPRPYSTEFEVKAAFLYNFAKFIEWPSQAFPGGEPAFTICVIGDPFEGALDRAVQGEVLDGRPLTVRHITSVEGVRRCQMIYIAASETQLSVLTAAANAPILTVGETEDFINEGGMIRFTKTAGRIRFQINPDAADRASLKVSSRLLRLADIVHPRQRPGGAR